MTAPLPKHNLFDLPPYRPGSDVIEGIANPVKLSSNETPLGPSPKAQAAYLAAADDLALYPAGDAYELRQALAKLHNLEAERIVCGAGSDELLELLPHAYAGKGDEIIHTAHGFLVYKLAARAAGANPISVPETDLTADVDNILSAVTQRTKIIFLANPNNPTGTMISGSELRRLHASLREDILLVIDGAYSEYVTDSDYENGFALARSAKNVVVTRTFSKIYGLAALRLGWAYAHPDIIDVLNRLRCPFNVNRPAQLAGLAALDDQQHIAKAVAHNNKWRDWLKDKIEAAGFPVTNSYGNFLLVGFPSEKDLTADAANRFLEQDGLIVRPVGAYGLPDYLRITIGTAEACERVADSFANMAAKTKGGRHK